VRHQEARNPPPDDTGLDHMVLHLGWQLHLWDRCSGNCKIAGRSFAMCSSQMWTLALRGLWCLAIPMRSVHWRCQDITVAILAQGTSWAVADTQAFLSTCVHMCRPSSAFFQRTVLVASGFEVKRLHSMYFVVLRAFQRGPQFGEGRSIFSLGLVSECLVQCRCKAECRSG